jgi:hypothetical protein
MESETKPLLVVVKVRVAHPYLVYRGVVSIATAILVVRLFMREILNNITGGSVEFEMIVAGFSDDED